MKALAVLSDLVAQLGRRIGVADLSLDANGVAALAVDDRFVLHIAADSEHDGLILYALLGRIRDDERLAIWRRLLEYNPTATDGSSLGLDPATGQAILVARHPLRRLDYHGFEQAVESFIATAETWAREFAAGAQPSSEQDDLRMHAAMQAVRA
jgi:hypothetical protein